MIDDHGFDEDGGIENADVLLETDQLAKAAGLSKPCLSQIGTGKRKETPAKALKVTLDEVSARGE